VLVVRVRAGQTPPRKDLLSGAAIAGVGLGVLRLVGTTVVSGSVHSNPALVPFAVIVVLLAWVNLMARILLTAAAWTADPPTPTPGDQARADSPGVRRRA
jgi:membrane protein